MKKVFLFGLCLGVFLLTALTFFEPTKTVDACGEYGPFNFETFATTAYVFASQDLLEAAAVPSLLLIAIASIFILVTSRYILKD